MSHPFDVVGYTADADSYCPLCASYIYGAGISGENGITDHEGNLVAPIFADSEWDYPVTCGKCHEYIDTSLTMDGIRYAYAMIQEGLRTRTVTFFLLQVADSLLWCGLPQYQINSILEYVDLGSRVK